MTDPTSNSRDRAHDDALTVADLAQLVEREDRATIAVRLTGRQWMVTVAIVLAVSVVAPRFWRRYEPFAPPPVGYRLPQSLSEDYWHWERWCELAAATHDVLVVGDSVVWGEYVPPGGALAGQIARLHDGLRVANLGVAGSHPAALRGLIEHHGSAIRGCRVIVHLNLLWMSSPQHDLSGSEEFPFHHARLVPQLWPRLACYRADASERVGNALEQRVELFGWVRHLRIGYFESNDLFHFTLDHPRENPLARLSSDVFAANEVAGVATPRTAEPWNVRGGDSRRDWEWVDAASSFQWRSFRALVESLRARGNRIVVVVGPFNEHSLSAASLERYRALRADAVAWLRAEGIAHVVPETLASELWVDASHPLEAGYARLARDVPLPE